MNENDYMSGIVRPEQKNELKEMIEELNSDAIEQDGFSKIDLRTRLSPLEISTILAVDIAVSMGALPTSCSKLTRAKKRLAVSLRGKGRQEMVQISSNEFKKKEGMVSLADKMSGNV